MYLKKVPPRRNGNGHEHATATKAAQKIIAELEVGPADIYIAARINPWKEKSNSIKETRLNLEKYSSLPR